MHWMSFHHAEIGRCPSRQQCTRAILYYVREYGQGCENTSSTNRRNHKILFRIHSEKMWWLLRLLTLLLRLYWRKYDQMKSFVVFILYLFWLIATKFTNKNVWIKLKANHCCPHLIISFSVACVKNYNSKLHQPI